MCSELSNKTFQVGGRVRVLPTPDGMNSALGTYPSLVGIDLTGKTGTVAARDYFGPRVRIDDVDNPITGPLAERNFSAFDYELELIEAA
jgi:hypothetical protein